MQNIGSCSHISCFKRPRQNCINEKQRCIKRAILINSTDCEEGIKKIFINLKEEDTEEKTIVPYLSHVGPLPDAPNIAKNLKISFNNWNLNLFNVRNCLSVSHTLRNKYDFEERKILKNLVMNAYEIKIGRSQF